MRAGKLPRPVTLQFFERAIVRALLELLMVIGGEGFEGGGIFAGDDLGFGVDAGLESVEAGYGLPLRRAGAGKFGPAVPTPLTPLAWLPGVLYVTCP